LGDCIPQTPALQSGKPLKLTHMGLRPLALPTGCPLSTGFHLFHILRVQGITRTQVRASPFWWGMSVFRLRRKTDIPHSNGECAGTGFPHTLAGAPPLSAGGGDLATSCWEVARSPPFVWYNLCYQFSNHREVYCTVLVEQPYENLA
jgi:hypothetical protein